MPGVPGLPGGPDSAGRAPRCSWSSRGISSGGWLKFSCKKNRSFYLVLFSYFFIIESKEERLILIRGRYVSLWPVL